MCKTLKVNCKFSKGDISEIDDIFILLSKHGGKSKGFSEKLNKPLKIPKNKSVTVNVSIDIN